MTFNHIANSNVEANFHKDKILALCEKFDKNYSTFNEKCKDFINGYDILWEAYFKEYRNISYLPYAYSWTPDVHRTMFSDNHSGIMKIKKLAEDCDEYVIISADTYNHLENITKEYHIDAEVESYRYALRSLETKYSNLKKLIRALEDARKKETTVTEDVTGSVIAAALITIVIIGGLLFLL